MMKNGIGLADGANKLLTGREIERDQSTGITGLRTDGFLKKRMRMILLKKF